jgi:hypothetical protein
VKAIGKAADAATHNAHRPLVEVRADVVEAFGREGEHLARRHVGGVQDDERPAA